MTTAQLIDAVVAAAQQVVVEQEYGFQESVDRADSALATARAALEQAIVAVRDEALSEGYQDALERC